MPSKKKKYNARFPPARIKKIMQTDEDVGKVAAAVPVIISRALELFIEALILKSNDMTQSRNARTLSTAHIKHIIESEKKFDFLRDLVAGMPNIADLQQTEEDDDSQSELEIVDPAPVACPTRQPRQPAATKSDESTPAQPAKRQRGRPKKQKTEEQRLPPKKRGRKKREKEEEEPLDDSSATEDANSKSGSGESTEEAMSPTSHRAESPEQAAAGDGHGPRVDHDLERPLGRAGEGRRARDGDGPRVDHDLERPLGRDGDGRRARDGDGPRVDHDLERPLGRDGDGRRARDGDGPRVDHDLERPLGRDGDGRRARDGDGPRVDPASGREDGRAGDGDLASVRQESRAVDGPRGAPSSPAHRDAGTTLTADSELRDHILSSSALRTREQRGGAGLDAGPAGGSPGTSTGASGGHAGNQPESGLGDGWWRGGGVAGGSPLVPDCRYGGHDNEGRGVGGARFGDQRKSLSRADEAGHAEDLSGLRLVGPGRPVPPAAAPHTGLLPHPVPLGLGLPNFNSCAPPVAPGSFPGAMGCQTPPGPPVPPPYHLPPAFYGSYGPAGPGLLLHPPPLTPRPGPTADGDKDS